MVVLATAGFVIGRAESALRLQVKPGDAWLPTNKNGSVNLVDGLSGRSSAALVLKGARGDRLIVTQVGGRVLVLDATTGLLVRINPVELLLGASLSYRPGQHRGGRARRDLRGQLLQPAPCSGSTRSRLSRSALDRLRWQPSGTAIVDKSGTLWVPVPAIGSVVPVTSAGAGRPVKVSAIGANVVMTSANGVPIAVDRTAQAADRDRPGRCSARAHAARLGRTGRPGAAAGSGLRDAVQPADDQLERLAQPGHRQPEPGHHDQRAARRRSAGT